MDKYFADILAATARLEEQAKGTRRDIGALKTSTCAALTAHERRVSSLERSRANAKGWLKGVSGIGIVSAIAGYFGWGGS